MPLILIAVVALAPIIALAIADWRGNRRVRDDNRRRHVDYRQRQAQARRDHTAPPCPPNRSTRE